MGELNRAVAGLASRDRIMPDDVTMLRKEVFGDGMLARAEAEALLALDSSAKEKCREWGEFLVEAVTDCIVNQEKPRGYVSEDNADWLIRAISRDGKVDTATELELLVKVLEAAKSSPDRLSAYALEQVAHAVIDGGGPLANGGTLAPGSVGKAEVDLLRRILHAFGGDGNIAISRAEAEVLFTINDRTAAAKNDPSWNDLFVKAMANFVLCASGYEAPPREEALRREALFEQADTDIGGFFVRMVSGGLRGVLDAYTSGGNLDADWEARNLAREAEARRAETVDAAEARWLAERIGRDGSLHENERALLALLKQNASTIHPDLRPLLDQVA